MTLHLEVLQLPTSLNHGLHLRLDLADVESGHRELLLDGPTNLHGLRVGRGRRAASLRQNVLTPFTLTYSLPFTGTQGSFEQVVLASSMSA